MRPNYVPIVGESVLVANHLGLFLVEGVDAEAKTANLRILRSNGLMKGVAWGTILPFDDETKRLLKDLTAEPRIETVRKLVEKRKRTM